MEKKTLFEIPIYAMSKKEFTKRWDKQRKKMYNDFISFGHTDESARQGISLCCFPRSVWEYNQIIGFIKISVSRRDVWFDIYRSLDKIYYADSKNKHFIRYTPTNDTHFYVSNFIDEQIKQNIRKQLKSIEKDHLKKSFYVDYSTFDNIFEYVDIAQIMKSM